MKQAMSILGPPGAGKGTQAGYIAEKLGLVEYDTGQRLRELIASGEIPDGGHAEGKLNDPAMVREMIKKDVKKLVDQDKGVIFSGSPRSVIEAFGDENNEGLLNFIEREYGKDNYTLFSLEIPVEESIKRNAARGEGRADDQPEVIKRRYEEQYSQSVFPTINAIEEKGFRVIRIDGMPSREEVFESIKKHLGK